MVVSLKALGLNDFFKVEKKDEELYARVIREHRDRYWVMTENGQYEAEITGKLRFLASSRPDYPAVGDWVIITKTDDLALIHKILPRQTILERRVVDENGERQILGTNIDMAFIMMGLDDNYNLNRLERYLAIVRAGRIEPVIILSKSDLLDKADLHQKISEVQKRTKLPDVISLSSISGDGLANIKKLIHPEKTYCVIGSSGVGKSTLINKLLGKEQIKTIQISDKTGKGKHTTTHREMYLLENNGILIDTPGMREVGLADSMEGVEETFPEIVQLSKQCRFNDCTHADEPGCAVQQAIANGEIDSKMLEHFNKLQREASHFSSTEAERRKKDKEFGKMAKQVVKERKNRKF